MNIVYCKISFVVIETAPDFFKKLKEFTGGFRIEAQSVEDIGRNMTISFYTDKVQFIEGESRYVDLEAKGESNGCWEFTKINKR